MNKQDKIKVKPFLKWAGGKSQLLSAIESNLPIEIIESKTITEYFEPFIGGGALFFYLMSEYDVKKAHISDTNDDLIFTYKVIKNNPEDLIELLNVWESKFKDLDHESKKDVYYPRRARFNKLKDILEYGEYSDDYVLQAAFFIFLNKTCFNGLYRVNSQGHFNVPMGRYKKPLICDEENIRNISEILNRKVTIENKSYECCEKDITKDSFVYLDPPYLPVTETSFTSYTKSNFLKSDHEKLASFYRNIVENNGAKVLLSNSGYIGDITHDDFYKREYGNFNIVEVEAKRYINSDGKNRGPVKEILIRSY